MGYPPCQHCGKTGHPLFKCQKRPNTRYNKCNQLGHEVVIRKTKPKKHEADAQVVDHYDGDQMLVATCFSTRDSSTHWLIDNGYTNHMTFDKRRTLQSTGISKV